MLEKEKWNTRSAQPRREQRAHKAISINVWIKSELTMLMNLPGCTLKPLALAVRRHPRALL
ncbi:hypothetical protein, partial [Pseudomonas syringae]|uniref:hypothetical protein n=1 Tax=Pseudomonas syringae TaxID=317 RepID=UPI001F4396B6